MQSHFVFEHKISAKRATKYFVVQLASLLLAIALSNLFESYNVYIRTVIVVVLLPFITYITHKFWTFNT
ncbi:hypothetical protein MNB_SV-6-507 [hydrothermal vent metagenome]|uniref:GtrA-like protein domain-containing protein n=1 Tax=hydrothermal vent metagenome TaxID=652676 RepID=A0A1W1CAN7_9ZZZZ